MDSQKTSTNLPFNGRNGRKKLRSYDSKWRQKYFMVVIKVSSYVPIPEASVNFILDVIFNSFPIQSDPI